MTTMMTRRTISLAATALAASLWLPSAPALANEDDPWPDLRDTLFGNRAINDGAGIIALEAPYRAHDAAIVPITMTAGIPQTKDRFISSLTLIIDENPAPVAAVFNMTPESGSATISTRVRVDAYTNIRVVAETNDGALFMATKFVKASGGCSAPAGKDHEKAMARLGKLKFKQFGELVPNAPNKAQILISHPNYSGLQMDQITRHYVPAHFVRDITVRHGGQTIMTVEGAISLSEDPSIHFHYVPTGPGEIEVEVTDTEEQVFTGKWRAEGGQAS